MVRIMRLRVYVEGLEHSYNGTGNVECNKGFPKEATICLVKRIATELLSPNKRSNHECGINCKRTIGILIGRTDIKSESISFRNAIPRYNLNQKLI